MSKLMLVSPGRGWCSRRRLRDDRSAVDEERETPVLNDLAPLVDDLALVDDDAAFPHDPLGDDPRTAVDGVAHPNGGDYRPLEPEERADGQRSVHHPPA